jgi:hypothetical protein
MDRRQYLVGILTVFMPGCAAADNIARRAAETEREDDEQTATSTDRATDTPSGADFSNESVGEFRLIEENGPATENWGTEADSIAKTLEIKKDDYTGVTFSLPATGGRFEYQLTVRSGPRIDAYLLEESEVEYFVNNDRFRYIEGASRTNIAGSSVNYNLVGGSYVFMLDNSPRGETSPLFFEGEESTATVTVEIANYE